MIVSEDEAMRRLEAAIEAAGGPSALARICGVTPTVISAMRSKSARRQPITGAVANYLGLRRITAYEENKTNSDPKQEQYEKRFKAWREQNGFSTEQSKNMRVAEPTVEVVRYPEKGPAGSKVY